MGMMVYTLLWLTQGLKHQPYYYPKPRVTPLDEKSNASKSEAP